MWIPISTCYPPDTIPVWLYLPHNKNIITGCRNGGVWFQCWDVYYAMSIKDKPGFWEAEHTAEEIMHPSHWQYLPIPPIEHDAPVEWEQE